MTLRAVPKVYHRCGGVLERAVTNEEGHVHIPDVAHVMFAPSASDRQIDSASNSSIRPILASRLLLSTPNSVSQTDKVIAFANPATN